MSHRLRIDAVVRHQQIVVHGHEQVHFIPRRYLAGTRFTGRGAVVAAGRELHEVVAGVAEHKALDRHQRAGAVDEVVRRRRGAILTRPVVEAGAVADVARGLWRAAGAVTVAGGLGHAADGTVDAHIPVRPKGADL